MSCPRPGLFEDEWDTAAYSEYACAYRASCKPILSSKTATGHSSNEMESSVSQLHVIVVKHQYGMVTALFRTFCDVVDAKRFAWAPRLAKQHTGKGELPILERTA
eukprot:5045212-Amphidinium_carterae.2